eukprot:2862035-Karenia_brevis.AAC.1
MEALNAEHFVIAQAGDLEDGRDMRKDALAQWYEAGTEEKKDLQELKLGPWSKGIGYRLRDGAIVQVPEGVQEEKEKDMCSASNEALAPNQLRG